MRFQREKRVESGWKFTDYFLLQEELAFVYEMLGANEEALVQYDELDALFTQFVLNHSMGDVSEWLFSFIEPPSTWEGVTLEKPINFKKRELIRQNKASLLDFRNYLFSRQCSILLSLKRPWELAQRAMEFLHNCVQEVAILEVAMPPGSISCWVFVSCLEILQACEHFKEVEAYSLFTASLWEYARKKLLELGKLCGLLPGDDPTTQQLTAVVDLIAGISQISGSENSSGPVEKLSEALQTKESFQRQYLGLSELTMGTYKHIGRIRSARLIGRDLAEFYMQLGEPSKAEGFLMDALKIYHHEKWDMLADSTRVDLGRCQKRQGSTSKYARSCSHVASSRYLPQDVKMEHYKDLLHIAGSYQDDGPLLLNARPAFTVKTIELEEATIITGDDASINMILTNHLPETVTCDLISISLNHKPIKVQEPEMAKTRKRNSSVSSCSDSELGSSLNSSQFEDMLLDMREHKDRKTAATSVVCHNIAAVMRGHHDSGPHNVMEREANKGDYTISLSCLSVTLKPGENQVILTGKTADKGSYTVEQMCIQVEALEFIKNKVAPDLKYEVVDDSPVIEFTLCQEIFRDIPFKTNLTVHTGSQHIEENSKLKIKMPDGVAIRLRELSNSEVLESESDSVFMNGVHTTANANNEEDNITDGDILKVEEQSEVELTLPEKIPYEHIVIPLEIMFTVSCNSPTDTKLQMEIMNPWSSEPALNNFTICYPLQVTHRLHTAAKWKYIQVVVAGKTILNYTLCDPQLITDSPNIDITFLNRTQKHLVVNSNQSASYIWQFKTNTEECPPINWQFSLKYQGQGQMEERSCKKEFSLDKYKTIYAVRSEVNPGSNEGHCIVGKTCSLELMVKAVDKVNTDEDQTFVYEIHHANKHWKVLGEAKCSFKLKDSIFTKTLSIQPLTCGFLPLPNITLFKQNSSSTPDNTMGELEAFSHGEVYNITQSSQILVKKGLPENVIATTNVTAI
ncbi:unnamed protein product [Owenia fusiformis]|uniref:Trafficking protein particle complex subunit 10 n=1 Tax=Owenia fusiformis TaxID=6347 RepID=A0A8J1XGE2_OWEFU|nr:unnamed protein product [Owenia fusiformis]